MQEEQFPAPTGVGTFAVEVMGAGRRGRRRSSRFQLRCDAIGLHDDEIVLLSVAGAETSVKALTAGLRSSGSAQQRIDYSADVGAINRCRLTRCLDGYRVFRTKFPYGLWHVLYLAQRIGFLPAVTEESLWRLFQGEQFTTPLMREWIPWLRDEMKRRALLVELTEFGCQAGLVLADGDALDGLVHDGLNGGHLRIGGRTTRTRPSLAEATMASLDDYLLAYGSLLGRQAERALNPLHVPGRDALPPLDLLREPFDAQADVIEAVHKALRRQKAVLLVAEMGCGKTIMGVAATHAHTAGKPYRGLVFCPGQLVNKWEREIRSTIPGAEVIPIHSRKTLLHLDRTHPSRRVEWYVIARDRAKLGAKWRPAVQRMKHDHGFLRCPQCGRRLVDAERGPLHVGHPAADGRPGTGL